MDKTKHIETLVSFLPDIDYGSSGSFVRALQKIMARYGWYDGAITGEADEQTVKGIRLTQIALGLDEDGFCGKQMWLALLS